MGRALGVGSAGSSSRGIESGRMTQRHVSRRRARILLVDDLAYVRESIAAVLNVNTQFLLPTFGFTLSPSLGVVAGF